ncbi:MAG: YggS family pyridoxal phosphate-dependent enzyme [Bacteroidetes bacterium 4572_112]|nr:MAG: YggS family pyridoxal phosphate-dependent enzyme [Bacteroidetes bacterium 4572_112]
MSIIGDKIASIKGQLPEQVRLVAVSKTKPIEDIQQAYDDGQRIFGENKALEMRDKAAALPDNIHWHFIGHLQRNKVKYIAPFVKLIHGVDSLKLLKEINKEALKNDRIISCLLQFHIASEETKFGLSLDEAVEMLSSEDYKAMKNIKITGVMGMASNTFDTDLVRAEFKHLLNLFQSIRYKFFLDNIFYREISMGMSNDYQIAVQEGSTLVRIGSSIFGARNYSK